MSWNLFPGDKFTEQALCHPPGHVLGNSDLLAQRAHTWGSELDLPVPVTTRTRGVRVWSHAQLGSITQKEELDFVLSSGVGKSRLVREMGDVKVYS